VVLLEWRLNKKKETLSANQYLAKQCKENGLVVKACDIPLFDIIFLIDEAQLSYGDDSGLWSKLIKDQLGRHSGPKLCLFSSYGSINGGTDQSPTPYTLGDAHRVSLMPFKEGPDFGLFYTRTEFDDVIRH
jgi:hypothetical protein